MEALALIEVSGDDDLSLGLASLPALRQPPDRDPPRAGFRVGAEAAADLAPTSGSPAAAGRVADPDVVAEDQAPPERTESPKQRKAKMGINLRKSLAWDSAFFTGEGVLDTEELAIVNSTFRKTQGSRLSGIAEESRRSGESTTSTLESESWAMENIETELFDNVCASIQRSIGKPNNVTAGPPGSSKPPRATANAPRVAARKGVDQMPQSKVRAPVSTSKGVGGKQRSQVTSKEPTTARVKSLPEDGEAKPSTRPPRVLPRVATMRSSTNTSISPGIPDKRSSTGGVVNRQAINKSATTSAGGRLATTSAGGRPGEVMKSSLAPKSGPLTAAATKPDTKNRTATQSSTKRTAQRIPIRSASKSDCSKTIPTRSVGNKIPARGGSNDCASPIISPNSSIDSMSSVISGASTASTIGKMSHTSESFSSLSDSLSPSLRKSNDHPLSTKRRSPNATEGQYSGTATSGDNLIATAGTDGRGKSSKPLGLRRPTPKKGYFDADKSTDQMESTKIQRLLPATPSKLPSAQMTSASLSSFGQQEPKFTVPPEESGASKSRAVKALSVKVAQMDAVPFEVAEPEACTHQIGHVVAQPEPEKSFVQTANAQVQQQPMEIKCPLSATTNSQLSSTQTMIPASSPISQKETKSTAMCHDEIIASTSSLMMKIAQMEVEPSTVAQMETIACEVAEHEACHDEIIACTNEALMMVPLKIAQMKVEPNPVAQMETIASTSEAVKEKSIDQNIGAQVQGQSMKISFSLPGTPNSQVLSTQTMNTAASTFDQLEQRSTEAPHEESSYLKSKADKAALGVAEAGAEPFEEANPNVVKTEVVKVVENESFVHQNCPLVTTVEASKENIPVLHNDASSLSVDLLIQKLSSVSLT